MGPYCIRSRTHWQESHQRGPLSSKAKGKTSLYKAKCLLTLFRAIILVPKAGLSRSLCKSFHRNLSILALMPSSHSSWLRTRAQPGWWHPSPHLEYSSFTRR